MKTKDINTIVAAADDITAAALATLSISSSFLFKSSTSFFKFWLDISETQDKINNNAHYTIVNDKCKG